jgi:hypothetical protein
VAFIKNRDGRPEPELALPLQQACEDYRHFLTYILRPALKDLEERVRNDAVMLHHAYGANLLAAHSVDYLLAIRKANGMSDSRTKLVNTFDEKFAVPGAYLRNRKMELIDAINNGLKHIRIDQERYKTVGERYGEISFQSLVAHKGCVMCHLDKYRFDYCRVVLLPALRTLADSDVSSNIYILEFAMGDFEVESVPDLDDLYDPYDPSTAIDRMIELSSSPCANCKQSADECRCSEYIFDGTNGRYEPLYKASASEIEDLMSRISPSYSRA